ncbi:MAG: acetyl xylan esterase [Marinilabiliaceae bacterium]|nr:acetyl xylan esterase [Marinilabiliaceae bacterium]
MYIRKILIIISLVLMFASCKHSVVVDGYSDAISIVGRVDSSEVQGPRIWASGAYFTFAYDGDYCLINIEDENHYGDGYNYLEVVVDTLEPVRFRTVGRYNTIIIGSAPKQSADSINYVYIYSDISAGNHAVMVVRDTESSMGYTRLLSVEAEDVRQWQPEDKYRFEFIGNSITCGAEADTTSTTSANYRWGDWHRAACSYGALTARAFGAQYMLTSVSGIGLMHSCCDMDITMPMVYDKINLRDNKITYDFSFNPDFVFICLGQNDGIQPVDEFVNKYADFVAFVQQHSPDAQIVLLSSPMANDELVEYQHAVLPKVVDLCKQRSIEVRTFFFSRSYNSGGADHPDVEEHSLIANELIEYVSSTLINN